MASEDSDPRSVELCSVDPEKPPLPGAEAQNGLLKAAPGGGGSAAGPQFTGLGKEQLLRAAGSPGWVRARRALLALFWLGWLAMLAAAALIVARAPRCQAPLGAAWWRLGAIYRGTPRDFGGDIRGVQARLDHVAELGAGGLLLGPLHPPPEGGDPPAPPRLGELDPALGTEEELGGLLKAAREKGVQVVVELTPDPQGGALWGSPGTTKEPQFQQGLKDAVGRWLQRGVGGVFLDGIEELEPSLVQELQNLTEQHGSDGTPRLFLGGTRIQDPPALLQLLRGSGGLQLLLGPFLQSLGGGLDPPGPNASQELIDYARAGPPLAWSLGTPWQRLPWLRPPRAPQLLLLLLAGLPGSPLLNHGDEIGGGTPGTQLTPMPWDVVEGGNSTEARVLALCRRLGELRRQEPVLAMGGAQALGAGPVMALLREGGAEEEGGAKPEGGANQEGGAKEGGANQEGGAEPGGVAEAGGGAKRFLVLLNPGSEPARPTLDTQRLPPSARLVLSTHRAPTESPLELGQLQLEPYEGLLLALHEPTP